MQDLLTRLKTYLRDFDKLLVLFALALSGFGVAAIASSLASGFKSREVTVQLIGIASGLILMLLFSLADNDKLAEYFPVLYCANVLLLAATLVFGKNINGNKSWIDLGFFNFQTSELAKLIYILTLSAHMKRVRHGINQLRHMLMICLHASSIILLVMLQGDMGSALVFVFIFIVLLLCSGLSLRLFGGVIALIGAAMPFAWEFVLRDDQKSRIIAGFNPYLDPQGVGYQPIQSINAIGSGMLTGSGYNNGIQTQLGTIPEQHTDFVFSIIGEEFGFVGAVLVLALLALLVYRIIRSALKAFDTFGMLVCTGVASMFIFQIVINLGMALGITPVIGITLPFVSSGGSSIMMSMLALGLVQSVNQTREPLDFSRSD